MSEIDNPRICRIREKMMPYNFQVSWLEGKSNAIADALSRNPIEPDTPLPIRTYVVAPSRMADEMKENAKMCDSYRSIVDAWKQGTLTKNLPPGHPGRQLKDVWNRLSLLDEALLAVDNKRIFVPRASRHNCWFCYMKGTMEYAKRMPRHEIGITGLISGTTWKT